MCWWKWVGGEVTKIFYIIFQLFIHRFSQENKILNISFRKKNIQFHLKPIFISFWWCAKMVITSPDDEWKMNDGTVTYLLALGVEPVVCLVPRFILEEFEWWLLLVLVLEALRGDEGEAWALFEPPERYDCVVCLLWLFKSSSLYYKYDSNNPLYIYSKNYLV